MSERLREAIQASDLSLRELAARAGVQASVLSRFVRGERSMSLQSADPIAAVLGLELRPRKGRKGKP